jgi:hypothetical protein
MPSRQAAVLWAREVEGQSYDEIAERYGLSEPTVRSLLHRARKTLRREYAARGGTLPVGGLIVLAPWLKSLSGLGKLRDAVRRAALSGAALSIAGLSAISAIGLSPTAPQGTPPTATAAIPVVTMPRAVAAVVVKPATPAAVHVATARHAAGTPKPNVVQHATGQLPCLRGSGDRAINCNDHQLPVLYVGPELPDNPTGLHRLGVTLDHDCSAIPTTAVTECRTNPSP